MAKSSTRAIFGTDCATLQATKKIRRTVPDCRPAFPTRMPARNPDESSVDLTLVSRRPPDDISDTLWTCPICLGVPRQPALLSTCGHVGCFKCLQRILSINGRALNGWAQKYVVSCPVCRDDFEEKDVKLFPSWHALPKAVFNMIVVECTLGSATGSEKPCRWTGSIGELVIHETFECRLREIRCPNPHCKVTGNEDAVREHFLSCPRLIVRCTNCNLPTNWDGRETHHCEVVLKEALRSK
jgi:hypothetical protein